MRGRLITSIFLISLIVLMSGCTGDTTQTEGPISGTLDLSVSTEDNIIEQGESTTIDLIINNMFSESIENVDVTLEPGVTGIIYSVTGPDSVDSESSESWDIEITTSPGLDAKPYNLYPVVCFDYTQEEKGYFTVADVEPSQGADFSFSDNGPISIIISGLQSFNINDEDKLDIKVSFSLDNSISGGTDIYDDLSDLELISGDFLLDVYGENLRLSTNEGGATNKLNKDNLGYCRIQTAGDLAGYALCYFTSDAGYNAEDQFDFDILTVEGINGEFESSFSAIIKYRYCFRSTSTSTNIVVEESN